jgi:hypothetical protein
MESIRSLARIEIPTDEKLNPTTFELEYGTTSALRATPNVALMHAPHRVEFYPLFGGVTLSTLELGY